MATRSSVVRSAVSRPARLRVGRGDASRARSTDTCHCRCGGPAGDPSPSSHKLHTSSVASRRSLLAMTLIPGAGTLLAPAGDADAFAFLEDSPVPEAAEVSEAAKVQAFMAVLDGREALSGALSIRGTTGGARLRLRNLLPRYKKNVEALSACLPILASVVPALDSDPGWTTSSENVLIGSSMVVAMNGFAGKGEFENFTDADIPFSDVEKAIQSVDAFLAQASPGMLDKAAKGRCKQRMNAASSMDEMRDLANSSVCSSGM